MMNVSKTIDELITLARKNKDCRLQTYLSIKAALQTNTHLDTKKVKKLSEIEVLQKMVKEREDSITIYKKNNREDLANKEQDEIYVIKDLLPKEPSKEEITKEVEDFIKFLSYPPTMKLTKDVIASIQRKYPAATKSSIVSIYKTYCK